MTKICIAAWTVTVLAGPALVGCSPNPPPAMTGWVEADLVYVAAAAGGRIEALHVARGDRVAAQAPLFELDANAEQLTRLQAEAQSAQAQAQAMNLRSGRRTPEVTAAAEQLAQAQAAQMASRATLERNEALVAQGFVSAARLDELRAIAARDSARVKELQAQLQVVQLTARPQEIAAAEAALRAAKAQSDLAQWREAQRAALAPVHGQVYDVLYRLGERVGANAPVVALLPDGALKLRFYAPEPLLAQFAVGRTVHITCDGCPLGLAARVTYVSPRAEFTPPVIYSNDSRSKLVFMVEARPQDEAQSALKLGQPVDVRLPEAVRSEQHK